MDIGFHTIVNYFSIGILAVFLLKLTSGNSKDELYGLSVIAKIAMDMLLRNIEKMMHAKPIIPANMHRVDGAVKSNG